MRTRRTRAILKAKGCRRTSNFSFPRVYSNMKRVGGETAMRVQGGKTINLFWVSNASLRQNYRQTAKASTKRKIGDSRLLKKRVARQMVYLLVSEDIVERCQLRVKNHIYENTEEAAKKLSQLKNKGRLRNESSVPKDLKKKVKNYQQAFWEPKDQLREYSKDNQ